MFWGLVMKANKRYSQQVTKDFHVSQAVLDLSTITDQNSVIQVWANIDDIDHLIANVSKSKSHVPMDLTFTEGESVAFYTKGVGTVHLSGYLVPEDDGFDFGGEGEEEEDEMDIDLEEQLASKKQQKQIKNAKKAIAEQSDDDDEDDDDSDDLSALKQLQEDDDDEDDESDEDFGEEEEDDEEDEDSDDDDEEDDDEEEDSETEISQPPAKQAKLDKTAKQNGLTNGKAPKKDNEEKNQKSKKQEKQEQKQKKDQKQPQQQQQQQQQKAKQLQGGVLIEDIRVGKGPEAKSGRKVSVYYEGRLKSNNKVFDSTKSGEGFKFNLGRGEVIRGWDIGIVGMKVGSKRRITCPANVAYGNKGSPPVIPGGATLIFDVELRGVN